MIRSSTIHAWSVRALAGAALGLIALVALAGSVGAQVAPFTAYGVGLQPGDVVEARVGSKVCSTAEADASGNWLLYVHVSDPCKPTDGATITFRLNGKSTDTEATYTPGGAPEDVASGFTLTVVEGGSFSTPIVAGTNLALFSGGNVLDAVEAAPNATAFFVSVGGKFTGYVVGAPAFVNAAFLAAFPDGDIPANTFMVVLAK